MDDVVSVSGGDTLGKGGGGGVSLKGGGFMSLVNCNVLSETVIMSKADAITGIDDMVNSGDG